MAEKFRIKAAKNGDFSKRMRLCKKSNKGREQESENYAP
jgi:hypothetical protein